MRRIEPVRGSTTIFVLPFRNSIPTPPPLVLALEVLPTPMFAELRPIVKTGFGPFQASSFTLLSVPRTCYPAVLPALLSPKIQCGSRLITQPLMRPLVLYLSSPRTRRLPKVCGIGMMAAQVTLHNSTVARGPRRWMA